PEARHRLEAIIHPRVAALNRERIKQATAGGAKVVVCEIPLLFETGGDAEFPTSILVYLDPASQLRRLMARSNLSEAAARARIASQMDLELKRRRATWVVDNGGSLASTRAQVEALWQEHLGPPGPARG
ncbi:MAG: dephospho-CoA kinase, partial [Candidatus Dormibacteria bacterium]